MGVSYVPSCVDRASNQAGNRGIGCLKSLLAKSKRKLPSVRTILLTASSPTSLTELDGWGIEDIFWSLRADQ